MLTESTFDWFQVGVTNLRKVHLYRQTPLPFERGCKFAVCSSGGPIAIGNSDNRIDWFVRIFSGTGSCLVGFKINDLFRLRWTKCQKLIAIRCNGEVRIFSVYGKELAVFDLDSKIRDVDFHDVLVFYNHKDTGLAIMDKYQRIFVVNHVIHRTIWQIAPRGGNRLPSCWTVVCSTGPTSVICCYDDDFWVGQQGSALRPAKCEWMIHGEGKYVAAQTSWDHSKIAFVHASQIAQVVSSDLEYCLFTITLETLAMEHPVPYWCGGNFLTFRPSVTTLDFYSFTGSHKSVEFSNPIWHDVDSDGIRVFEQCLGRSSDSMVDSMIITVVPLDLENTLKIGVLKPGSLLFDCYTAYMKDASFAFDCLIEIKQNMLMAIEQCLNAAANHFDSGMQKKLIGAARLGKAMIAKYDCDKFVYINSLARCLNAVRNIGYPISFSELTNELTLPALVDRLIELRHWPLALIICKTMGISQEEGSSHIVQSWTNTLLEEAANSEKPIDSVVIANKIFNQFSQFPEKNYAEIADVVYQKGKRFHELASLLLERETDATKKVNMLLKFGNVDTALEIAANSHLPNLAYMVISHLKNSGKRADVDLLLLTKMRVAAQLYQGLVRETTPKLLLTLYEQQDNFLRQALYHLESAETPCDTSNPFDMPSSSEYYTKAEKCFAKLGNSELESTVRETSKLLSIASDYESKTGKTVPNQSLRDAFSWALGEGCDTDLADRFKKEFKLTDRQVWRWTIDAYVRTEKWSYLSDLAYKKQFPGYLNYVEACVRHRKLEMAETYAQKIDKPDAMISAYCLIENFKKAAEIAYEKGDVPALRRIVSLCRSQQDKNQVMSYVKNLNARKTSNR